MRCAVRSLATGRAGRLAVAVCVSMVSGLTAEAQTAGAGSPATEQRARATVSPPMVIEDDAVVRERERNLGLIEVWTYPPLRQDNVGLPELTRWVVDPHEDDAAPATRDLLEGWNAGGSAQIFPPDCGIAVSPTHVVVTTNAKLKFYDRAGTQTGSVTWSSFFSSVLPSNTFTTDPKVLYDPGSGRFFILILAIRSSDFKSWYLIAVSDDSDPNGIWAKYAIDSTLNGQNTSNNWSDYPGFGFDSQAVVVTANMFSRTTGAYRYVKIRILNKQELINFAPTLTWTDIWNITDPDGGTAFTIQPAVHHGPAPFTFLADANPSNKVSVFGIQDPLGSATLFKKSKNVGNYNQPPAAEQPGGDPRLDTIDNRVYNVVWRNNSVYFAHTVGASSQAAVRWYEIDTSDYPNTTTLVQNGLIADPASNHFFPAIEVNSAGTVAIGFCRSSTTEFASIYYAAHQPGDPAGQVGPLTLIKAGTVHYTGEGGSVVRWGDYSGIVVDPTDDQTFWHFNQYPNPNNNGAGWRVWVQRFSVGAPPCPGDFNGDGVIDIGDLSILLANFGGSGDPSSGDLDGDGDVDLTDLANFLAVFGTNCP